MPLWIILHLRYSDHFGPLTCRITPACYLNSSGTVLFPLYVSALIQVPPLTLPTLSLQMVVAWNSRKNS